VDEPTAQSENHGAVTPLDIHEPWQRRRDAELVGIGRIDTSDQWLSDALERLGAEAAADERAETFVVTADRAAAARQQEIQRHPRLATPREQRRRRERRQPRRRQQLEAVGQRMQPAAEPDEDFAKAIVGANQPALEAQTPTQRERPRLLGQKRVGTRLDQVAVGALGGDAPAEAAARLDQLEVEVEAALARELHRAVGRRQPCDAAADDEKLHCSEWRENGSNRG
jgi:hypothetical protein